MKKRILFGALTVLILACVLTVVYRCASKSNQLIDADSTTVSAGSTLPATTKAPPTTEPAATTQKATAIKHVNIREMGNTADGKITLGFTGDINLDETWKSGPMQYLKNSKNGIADFIEPNLIRKMKDSDILFVNNEFAFSTRGDEQEEKAYTFRANPSNIQVFKTLGVDAVSIANNHIYDFRDAAMQDTMDTLKKADIAYVGGGSNLAEAMKPVYFKINGKIIAYVAAANTVWYYRTPAAGRNSMGVLDAASAECMKAIQEAAANSDYVFVYLHWGTDYQFQADAVQMAEAKKYIDAGADAIIGAHPHVLQGMDFYKDKFIAYSLGNFWFNMKNYQTGYLELTIDKAGKIEPCFVPCRQVGGKTYIEKDTAKRNATIHIVEQYSPNKNIKIDANGLVTQI